MRPGPDPEGCKTCNSTLQGLARVGKVEVRIRTGIITRRAEHERDAAAKIPREETRNKIS